jgi:8-oxo-dGTP pyrophosphatase MutT (NUDIX family)
MIAVRDVETVLGGHTPRSEPDQEGIRRAAVAAVLRDNDAGAEVLFIHRSEHPADPWSGHMAFPGGRMDPDDPDPLAAANRETLEELALDLDREARLIGRLSDVPAVGRGRPMPLVIVPYVFELEGSPTLVPNHEVAAVVWVPLSFLVDRTNRSTLAWNHGHMEIPLPCYRYEEHVIWGLTFGMVDELVELVAPTESGPTGWRKTTPAENE